MQKATLPSNVLENLSTILMMMKFIL